MSCSFLCSRHINAQQRTDTVNTTLPYRKNVAAFILNDEGRILTCRRADQYKDWQLPQGGIDGDETPEVAIRRELKEEVGLNRAALLGRLPDPVRYEWPPELHSRGFIGQEQYFFIFRAPLGWKPDFGQHSEIEFEAASWDGKKEFLRKIEPTFRGVSYKKAVLAFSGLYPDLIAE
jgi:putative (di)nucleoside polyphosphate hydrolase